MTFYTDNIRMGNDWRAFERVVARLIAHIGFSSVSVIGKSGDMGGDVVGIRTNDGHKEVWVFQAKSVAGDKCVGTNAINEVVNAMGVYHAEVGVVVTNGEFTFSAENRKNDLLANGFNIRLWNGNVINQLMNQMDDFHGGTRNLRPYQCEIVDKVVSLYQSGVNKAFYVVATGLGKTVIAATIAKRMWDMGNRRILVLCHAVPLSEQLEQGFWPQLTKDIPTSVFHSGLPPRTTTGISFGLYQSLYGYLAGLEEDQFDIIIVDEAHHALAHGFRSCLDKLKPKMLIGMTATPWRGDGRSLSEIFGTPVARVSLVDGMANGYLSKVDYRMFCDNINWKEIPYLSKKKLTIRDLNKRLFLPQRDEAILAKIKSVIEKIDNPKILVFSPSKIHGEKFAEMLSVNGIPCKALSCGDKIKTTRRILEFSSGKLMAATAVDVMNEGIDIPDVNVLVFLRATHSRRIFVQQLGRGLRIAKNKEKVVVLDFVSDIRRVAEIISMNNEGKVKGKQKEVLYLQNGFVSFDNARIEKFVDAWLKDVADLSDADENVRLGFPEDCVDGK